jgi:hypothetical protein
MDAGSGINLIYAKTLKIGWDDGKGASIRGWGRRGGGRDRCGGVLEVALVSDTKFVGNFK